ncbi:MAG: 6-phosphogluconolactonase [Thermomicrobiales bacterium]|nr:6-phosphogluconolactonase [Thermomicrobiales bacterium]
MRLIVTEDYEELSAAAAGWIADRIATRPDGCFIPATGDTPMGGYARLTEVLAVRDLDASRLRIVQLDEYLGLPAGDPRLLYGWMERSLLEPLAIPAAHVVAFDSAAYDPVASCRTVDEAIVAAGGADFTVLGLGPNGHLGFNEPPADADAPTRVIELTPESIHSNAVYWGGEDRVPRRAMTVGMNRLLAARAILLLVSGESKRSILHRTLSGPATPEVPSSYLQSADGVTIIADRAAWGDQPVPVAFGG